jgi:4'-phosphopantetheinyl transferase
MSEAAFLYYLLPRPTNASLIDRYYSALLPEERRSINSLAFRRDRNERLLARVMVRKALSDLTGASPSLWRFRRNAHGRPEIEAPSEYRHLNFSVSHAGGLVACLLSWRREVGVDVEPIEKIDDMFDIADRYFAASEADSLRALPYEDQCRRFVELWTLKESYLKARGSGLSTPLTEVVFNIEDGAISASFDATLADDPGRWQFSLERLDTYIIATAVERRGRARTKIVLRDAAGLMNRP